MQYVDDFYYHRNPALLTVCFPEDQLANDLIRHVPGRRWSYSRWCWTVPNTRESIVQIGQLFGKAYCRFDEAAVIRAAGITLE